MVMIIRDDTEVVVLKQGECQHRPERVVLVSAYLVGVLAILILHMLDGLRDLKLWAMRSTIHRTYYLESTTSMVIFYSLVFSVLYTIAFYVVNIRGWNKKRTAIMTTLFLVIDWLFLWIFVAPQLVA